MSSAARVRNVNEPNSSDCCKTICFYCHFGPFRRLGATNECGQAWLPIHVAAVVAWLLEILTTWFLQSHRGRLDHFWLYFGHAVWCVQLLAFNFQFAIIVLYINLARTVFEIGAWDRQTDRQRRRLSLWMTKHEYTPYSVSQNGLLVADISQGNVATRFSCDGIFSDCSIYQFTAAFYGE